MVKIKTKTAAFLCICVFITTFFPACSGAANGTPPNEKIFFTDKNGISFSLQTTPCSGGRGNGAVALEADGENTYLYSADMGRSFHKVRERGVSLNRLEEGSFSVCLMERDMPDTVTDIYTVYLESTANPYPITVTAVSGAEKIVNDGEITLRMENFAADTDSTDSTEYEATVDGWETSAVFSGGTVSFPSLGEGIYFAAVREKDNPGIVSPTLRVPVAHEDIGTKAYIEAAALLQNPELPTGCEVTSLTMLLNHIGFDVDKLTLADEYLPKGEYRKADYRKVFVGNPRDRDAYGCTADVIAETAEKFLSDCDTGGNWRVVNLTGCTPKTLYSAVKHGNPVVVWGSINMGEIIEDYVTWTDEETGELISWVGGEHCMLLTGYDMRERAVYVNDPLRGQVSYDVGVFEERFEELGRNAVIIIEGK
ncbi:MAG: C39 family peptidase [Ruminococcus sp.]|nr:C39 family peptidase [Ruminococcus sp.]MCM1380812.1 C39 family peptidase [Muribaculaceae bacterium]MCM1479605.1 C39 family peptidase [Muribaculaceae bacterium]